jgi:hypothetical protein
MRITMRHYFDFGSERALVGDDLARPEAWDALRVRSGGPFAMPESRGELDRVADEHLELAERARIIDAQLEQFGVETLASYGAGAGLLEIWLERLHPERKQLLTDYAPQTVERLRALFPEADVSIHDLLGDAPLEADAHLFHRVDTELTDDEWRDLLARFEHERVVVVATEVATLPRLAAEVLGRVRRRGLSRAGWLRTRDAFEALWEPTHSAEAVDFHDLRGWVLEPRRPHNITAP